MVFKDGCALDLAVPLWRIAHLGTALGGGVGLGWGSLPSLMDILSARLCPVRLAGLPWPWATRQWYAQTIVGTSTASADGAVWWFPTLSALVATRHYGWW